MSLLSRLTSGLSKSSSRIAEGVGRIFGQGKLGEDEIAELEELLIASDMGVNVAMRLSATLKKEYFGKETTPEMVKDVLAGQIAQILKPVALPVDMAAHKPFVMVMVGVNGNGKTTTLGKLARQYTDAGKKVLIVACDTFRAAAVEQLGVWAERSHAKLVRGAEGADPASVAHLAMEQAKEAGVDVVLIDTAGRLQNKKGLMEELAKLIRVIQKTDPTAPHATLLVLDATTGQNAHSQVESFKEIVPLSGMVITKLDGSAKGGVVVALADRFSLPIHWVGVGEGVDDLRVFEAESFAKSLLAV